MKGEGILLVLAWIKGLFILTVITKINQLILIILEITE